MEYPMKLQSDTGKQYFDAEKFYKIIQKNNGTFRKPVNRYRRVWKFFEPQEGHGWAYGIEAPAVEWLASNCEAIEFKDTDNKTRYIISMEHFMERAIVDRLGSYGDQYFIRTDLMDNIIEPKPKKARKVVVESPALDPVEERRKVEQNFQMTFFG
jgi:hypothetical protein